MPGKIPDLDIYRSAKLLVDQHGEDAGLEADMQADAVLEKGAMAGAATWRRIVKAVEELQRQSSELLDARNRPPEAP